MKRRTFLTSLAALAITPALPPVLPEPVLPTRVFGNRDLYLSAEALVDIKRWGCNEVDEATRKEILVNGWRD